MAKTTDTVALNDWQAVGRVQDVAADNPRITRLLGQRIRLDREAGEVRGWEIDDTGERTHAIATQERYGHVFATLGEQPRALLEMPEFDEPGRRLITCGIVTVKASPLRIVENFLDMAHFPFVHSNILGAEPDTEVAPYKAGIREDVDEVWATECSFFQQQAAMSASGGIATRYEYRVTSPFITVLYKTCPIRDDAWDLIGLFVQPLAEDHCDVHTFMLLYDEDNPDIALVHFQQVIFLQDRSILENQRPTLMPLEPGVEKPIRADLMSSMYRRWLRAKNLRFGALPAQS